jgi:tripartite-type tricarboxylate transporter receptor subunit TctC
MTKRQRGFSHFAAAAALALAAGTALAQAWPTKTVHIIVAWPAGGAVDVVARVMAPKYAYLWGGVQPVIVENRTGAGGNIGADFVSKSVPDGYTLLVTTSGLAIAPALYKKLNFDPVRDIVPVSPWVGATLIVVANNDFPARSIKELIALAKAQPGKINFGSTGIGSAPHLSGEQIKMLGGIDIVHVPYKGDAFLFPALFSGEVQTGVVPAQTGLNHVKAGKIRALAVTADKRSRYLPDVPTVAESGLPEFEYSGGIYLFGPSGMPRDLVNKINADSATILRDPDVTKHYPGWGVDNVHTSAEAFAALYRADIERMQRIVRTAKIPQVD